jgi:hypothetical protein
MSRAARVMSGEGLAPSGGRLPLFTELPRRGLLGNRASGVRNSWKFSIAPVLEVTGWATGTIKNGLSEH